MRKILSLQILRNSILPVLILSSLTGVYIYFTIVLRDKIPENMAVALSKAFMVLIAFSITFMLSRVLGSIFEWYKENITAKTASTLDDELLPLFHKTANIALWTIAMILLLSKLGLNINALVATLGVGSLAIALAAQDTIANIIAGFLIMIDRPFRIGDQIMLLSGEKVKVLDIGVRRSHFLAENGSVVIIPNVDLSKSKIVNFTLGEEIKRKSK